MEEQDNENIKRNVQENFEPVLVNVEKIDPDSSIRIDKDEFKIGRGKTNDEIIMNVSISRQHCIFKRTGCKEWTIEDTSSNGTYVNGTLLSQGDVQRINIGDLVQFGPMSEFSYKFEINEKSDNEPLAKKRRITTPAEIDLTHIVMRQKTFEESQQLERDNLAERMKAKHNEQLELRNELEKLLKDRETALGEKDHLNKQINSLEKNIEDVKVAEMNLEKLNRELSERLDKERHEFEVKLNEEKQKMEKALEISRKEREILENNMREELERLKNEQEIECKKLTESLTEEKKTAEKLQSEKVEFAQKLKSMEDALVKIEAKANELQTTLEKQNAAKAPTVMALATVAENVEIVNDSNLKILDTIDLTDEGIAPKNSAETSDAESSNKNVFNKVGDIMDEQLTCSICSELFVTAVTLNCTHTFCQYCINTWIKKKRECPVCRRGITAMNRSLVLDNFIDKMVENLSLDYKKRRTEIVKERRESERLAAEAVNRETGKRGRGRGRGRGTNPPANAIANINPNRTRGAATAATSGTAVGTNQPPSRTDGGNTNRNSASGSGSQLSQQSTSSGNASIDEQITTTQGTSNDTSQRTNDFDDSDGSAWSTSDDASTNGDGDGDSITPSYSVSQTSEDPETQFGDMDSIFGDSDDNSFEHVGVTIDYDDDPWSQEPDEDYEEGLPGAAYGGYGACYYCGNRGHWAPGCPHR